MAVDFLDSRSTLLCWNPGIAPVGSGESVGALVLRHSKFRIGYQNPRLEIATLRLDAVCMLLIVILVLVIVIQNRIQDPRIQMFCPDELWNSSTSGILVLLPGYDSMRRSYHTSQRPALSTCAESDLARRNSRNHVTQLENEFYVPVLASPVHVYNCTTGGTQPRQTRVDYPGTFQLNIDRPRHSFSGLETPVTVTLSGIFCGSGHVPVCPVFVFKKAKLPSSTSRTARRC
eukprot:573022-Rhodomonas_salina.1